MPASLKRTLRDASQDPNAKELFIKAGNKKRSIAADAETKMLNTRVPKDLIKRVKVYCAEHEITVQQFITETIEEKLK